MSCPDPSKRNASLPLRTLLLFTGASLVVSCTTAGDPPPGEDSPLAPDASRGGGDPDAGSNDPPDEVMQLSPTYTMDLRSTVLVRDTETGEEQTLETRAGGIVRMAQESQAVEMQVEMCYATPPEIDGNQPTIPDGVVAAVEPFTVLGTLESTEQGASLTTEQGGLVLGADLSDPLADALPTSADDPRVIDQDNDGNPGITIDYPSFIGTIEIYAAAKFTFTVTSMISNPETFEGTSEAELLTEIYGDNSILVDVRQMAEDAEAANEILSEEHQIFMDASEANITCAQVTDD